MHRQKDRKKCWIWGRHKTANEMVNNFEKHKVSWLFLFSSNFHIITGHFFVLFLLFNLPLRLIMNEKILIEVYSSLQQQHFNRINKQSLQIFVVSFLFYVEKHVIASITVKSNWAWDFCQFFVFVFLNW